MLPTVTVWQTVGGDSAAAPSPGTTTVVEYRDQSTVYIPSYTTITVTNPTMTHLTTFSRMHVGSEQALPAPSATQEASSSNSSMCENSASKRSPRHDLSPTSEQRTSLCE